MSKPDFSMNELFLLLQKASLPEGEGISTKEAAEEIGKSREWVRRRFRKWHDQGLLDVSQRPDEDMTHRRHWTYVYKLKNEPSDGSDSP